MPTPAETPADRNARLEKAALERDRAVALLREVGDMWMLHPKTHTFAAPCLICDVREFLESLT